MTVDVALVRRTEVGHVRSGADAAYDLIAVTSCFSIRPVLIVLYAVLHVVKREKILPVRYPVQDVEVEDLQHDHVPNP